jgi:WD40 repeat protein
MSQVFILYFPPKWYPSFRSLFKQWNTLDNFKYLQTLEGHSDLIKSLAHLPNGDLVSGDQYEIRIRRNSSNGYNSIKLLLSNFNRLNCLLILPNENIAAGYSNGKILFGK